MFQNIASKSRIPFRILEKCPPNTEKSLSFVAVLLEQIGCK
jgi:hypothetical protein